MKAVKVVIGGREQFLLFNGAAMFAVDGRFGGAKELLNKASGRDRESFTALLEAVALLAEQGELARRYLGHRPRDILTVEQLLQVTMPSDVISLNTALVQAIGLGFGREIVPEADEVDLGLAELDEKKRS